MIWGRTDAPSDALFVFTLNPRFWYGEGPGYVETLDQVDFPKSFDQPFRFSVPGVMTGRSLTGQEMPKVIDAWNAETGEDQARCHIPRHGLATLTEGQIDWFASICFECANVYIAGAAATENHRIIGWDNTDLKKVLDALLEV